MEQRFAAFAGFGQTKMAALKAAVAQHSQQLFEKEKPVPLTPEEEEMKVQALRASLGVLPSRAQTFCTDDCLRRYLRARNWNLQQADKMLRDTLRWRHEYRPEEIRWEDVAEEAATGKVYRTNFLDSKGRSVIIMSAGQQNTKGHAGQVRHLVYCLENAILNLDPTAGAASNEAGPAAPADSSPTASEGQSGGGAAVPQAAAPTKQEQMVWFIDFRGWTLRKAPPLKTAREVLNILQNHYPERLGAAVAVDPPNVFEAFWKVVRPFIDPVTFNKILFVSASKPESTKKLEDLFGLEQLDQAFGGRATWTYDHAAYGGMMKRDDERLGRHWGLTDADRRHKQEAKDERAQQQEQQEQQGVEGSLEEIPVEYTGAGEGSGAEGGAPAGGSEDANSESGSGQPAADGSGSSSDGSSSVAVTESPWLPADMLAPPRDVSPIKASTVLKSFNKMNLNSLGSSFKKPSWMGQ